MADLKIRWDTSLIEGDFIFTDNDFETDEGLATAVLISWFTDQRASVDDLLPNGFEEFTDRRGWWGDLEDPIVQDDQIGSLLWLLSRSKTTTENLTKAIEYGDASLQWLIEDRIAKEINVTGERILYQGADYISALAAEITKADGSKLNITFDPEWFATLQED